MPDAAHLAAIHAASFTNPRPWTAAEIAGLLDMTGSFLAEVPGGFVLGRVVLDEAELLTIAVEPQARRRGLGAALVSAFESRAQGLGATLGFLEVAADNLAATALYTGAGWQVCGRRKGYYRDGPGGPVDALLMRRTFAQPMA